MSSAESITKHKFYPQMCDHTKKSTASNNGARYICTRCGNCCRWQGYVHLTEYEITEIAQYLEMQRANFIARYTRLAPSRKNLALTEKPDQSCIFLTAENLCAINPVKPEQCRRFPNDWSFPGCREKCNALDTQADPIGD